MGSSNTKETINTKEDVSLIKNAVQEKEKEWLALYKSSIRSVEDLSKFITLDEKDVKNIKQVSKQYNMRIPEYYFSLIKEPQNLKDPVRMQSIPDACEIDENFHESIDPLGEEKTSPVRCLVHRYPDRALLIVTNNCFMYCRHCTRKRIWRKSIPEPSLKELEQALEYVKSNKSIREIIISGGDPLTLSTERLDYILASVAKIKNIDVIRIGTRAPVVLPQRIDDSLCKVLGKYDNLWINTQFNHPNEITAQSTKACRKLQKAGIPLSNQSVLLKGINDTPEIMMQLCHKLQSIKVRPYYLFQCDAVVGVSHFRTSVWRGVEIIEKMRGHTSGMCVPTYVIDGEDGKGKIPIGPQYLISMTSEGVVLRNYKNECFFYYNPQG